MIIKNMFSKPIDRDIKGVIKVGQDDDANIKQELEEYVVTRELQKHFSDFFASYKRGITGNTDKMGVWISGFFGSGKSHFLKILSYLLENKEVGGKKAIDYFVDDNKISDQMVLADMKLAGTIPTDVVLFNIDSKSEVNGKQSKVAIVSVLQNVFNEMQGFSGSNPFLADLERKLTEEGKYNLFKEKFEDSFGSAWEESRSDFDFIQDDVVEVLDEIGFMSIEAGRNWCEKATGEYTYKVEDFARLVKKYLDKKESNHHIVFLIDEIGQYIGDDSKLMLNLQTVTEDLGTACGGKAWIIVTSQQDIDSITKTKGNDFSKIQGRFDTRLSLSSANVDEVIKKRILEKNEAGKQTLTLLYDDKATVIKNLILFNDGVEKKLYSDRVNFADIYPFIPYQFNLLGSVLTSIRTHGASGKHLAEGERSMLALFKESAVKVMNDEPGTIVPFNMFYDALEQFLDHSHKGVISRALDNDYLNPKFHDTDDWKTATELSFEPDADNCIPITDEEYFEDDIVGLFCAWLKKVYGEDTLEENLDFIANALGNKGKTSREVIRNYFLTDFIKDHIKTYQKRPIYWLFDSGKQNGFKALVYMHRWNADTIGNVRVEYLHRIQRVYEKEITRMQEIIDNSHDNKEISNATKRKEKLQKQIKETKDYDAKIAHLALSRIDIDLDDGVKVNYEKVQTADGKKMQILAKI